MAPFQILPSETKFYDWFEKGAENLVNAATLLCTMLADGHDWPGRVAQLTEMEHHGDFITHEIFELLHKTFITPLDPPEIEALASSLDDTVDFVHAAADTLILYRIEQPLAPAHELAKNIVEATKEIAAAVACLRDKKLLRQIMPRVLEINRLENEADRIGRAALSELIGRCENNLFDLIRWKEVYEQLEEAADRCEDVADVLRTVVIKYA
jgi:predicted phosphate transport protein (TIGR00153 family)